MFGKYFFPATGNELGTMGQAEFDALSQNRGQIMLNLARNVLTQNIATQRQRQSGPFFPPFAQIDNFSETGTRIRELTFVNDEARMDWLPPIFACFHRVEHPVEILAAMIADIQERLNGQPWTGNGNGGAPAATAAKIGRTVGPSS